MEITKQEFEGWCNCFNFPHEKCDECKLLLGQITQLNEGEFINEDSQKIKPITKPTPKPTLN